MTENQHLAKLLEALRARVGQYAVIFKHADAQTAGVPDFSLTADSRTSWWEVKVAEHGKIRHRDELQRTNMRMLAVAGGRAWYLIWDEYGCGIALPKDIKGNGTYSSIYHNEDIEPIIDYIVDLHRGYID